MRAPALLAALLLLAACGGPSSSPDREPAAAPPPGAAMVQAPAPAPVAARRPAPIFSDPLRPGAGRPAGQALARLPLAGGRGSWSCTPGIVLGEHGATAAAGGAGGGAHHAIPAVGGRITVEATVRAAGSGFTGIALGRGDLSGDFWSNDDILLLVREGGVAVQVAGKPAFASGDRTLLSADGADRLRLELDTVAGELTASLNGKAILSAHRLPAALRAGAIDAAGFRFNEQVVAGRPAVSDWRATVASAATAGLAPVDLAMCFVEPDRPAVLRWTTAAQAADGSAPYVIRGYDGRQVEAGSASLDDDGVATIGRAFATGWYEIEFTAARQSFGVVALPAHRGVRDPFFAMDAALSWLDTDPVRRDALVRILARSGICLARERLGLGSINPAPGTYVWEHPQRRYDSLRQVYAREGVQVLEMLHGGGKHHELSQDTWLPTGFPRLAESNLAQLARWGAVWGGVEIENEPDLKGVPAEQYACIVKAASWAHAQGGSALPLVAGVYAGIPPGPYFEACSANGMLADSDAVSFHSYDRADSVEAMVARYRAWLQADGREALPLWHSECGWPWVKGPDRAPRDQDADSAVEIAFKGIESLACGVARYFPFVYVHYEEGPKCFGMMGREGTSMRSMAAYAASIAVLSGMRYEGDLQGVEGAKLARVFSRAGDPLRVVALYAGRPAPGLRARLPSPILRAAGADGRALAPVDGAVPLDDGMAYVWIDAVAAEPHLRTDAPAARLAALGRAPLRQQRLASPLVLQFLAQQTPARASSRRYLISAETARALPLRVRIQNLSTAALTVRPALTLPGGQALPAGPVVVPAQGMAETGWTVDASGALDIADTRLLTVTAGVDGAAQPSPLAIPMVMEGDLGQHLARHRHQRPLPVTDLALWQANHAGHGSSQFAVEEGVWRLTDSFTTGTGSWDYPKFSLRERIDPARESGFILRARILKKAGTVAILANPNRPDGFWCKDLFPADGAWHTVYIPFAELIPGPNGAGMQNTRLDPSSWTVIALGMGGHQDNTYEISHLLVVGDGG